MKAIGTLASNLVKAARNSEYAGAKTPEEAAELRRLYKAASKEFNDNLRLLETHAAHSGNVHLKQLVFGDE